VLTLDLEDFMIELESGAVKHVGTKTKTATVKLYHVGSAEARAFGDDQVKFAFADDEGNEVEVALDAETVESLVADVDRLREEGPVFE
jgi:uncharacterized lipoprotein NlpE involved in copper resistance